MFEMLQSFRNFIWGVPLITLILGTGFVLTVLTRGFQITHLFKILKTPFTKDENLAEKTGIISPLQAASVAIGAAVGVGNVGGVATAIAVGGPGALFWIWVAAFMGKMIKMAEVTLAVYYRKTNALGETYGGPTYYIEQGLGVEKKFKYWKIIAIIFGFGFSVTAFITLGNYNTSDAIASTFNVPILVPSFLYAFTVFMFTRKGIKGLGEIAAKVVPILCLFYVTIGLIVIVINFGELPGVLKMVFLDAFKGRAAIGGFTGVAFAEVIRIGFARAVYSNEAGWGTSPNRYATAKTSHPIKEGMYGAFEVFTDTIVICSITALVILVTGEWKSGVSGAALTLNALETVMGRPGRIFLTIGIFFLGVTTGGGWYSYFEVIFRHLLGEDSKMKEKLLKWYRVFYSIPGFLMVLYIVVAQRPGKEVWLFADLATGIPTFINVGVVLILTPTFLKLLKDYKARYWNIGEVDKDFKVFYEEKCKDQENISK